MWPILLLTAIKAGTTIYSGFKEKETAEENAQMVRAQALEVEKQYQDKAKQIASRGEAYTGHQVSSYASAGVKVDSGSPLAVLNETRKNIQQDISRTKQLGNIAVKRADYQATQIEKAGDQALTSSLLTATTDMFSGAYNAGLFDPKKTITTQPIAPLTLTDDLYNKSEYGMATNASSFDWWNINKRKGAN